MSTLTIEAIKKELTPPPTWNLNAAREYRKQLTSRKGMYAPIGVVGFREDVTKDKDKLPPDSFPFYKFTDENEPDNNEILKRGQDIYKWMGKYNPFSYDNYSARIRDAIKKDQREVRELVLKAQEEEEKKRKLEEAPEQPKAKKRRVENLDIPPSFILITDARKFNYDADNMTEGKHYLKSSVQKFLNKLKQEHADRQFKIMNQIRDEMFVYRKTGTPGKYVNVYTYSRAMRLATDTEPPYENIFPGLKVDNMGFKKWKRYATNMRKLLRRESIYGERLNDLYNTEKRTPTDKGAVKTAIPLIPPIPYARKTGDMKKGFVRETIPSGDMVGFDPTLPYEWNQVGKSGYVRSDEEVATPAAAPVDTEMETPEETPSEAMTPNKFWGRVTVLDADGTKIVELVQTRNVKLFTNEVIYAPDNAGLSEFGQVLRNQCLRSKKTDTRIKILLHLAKTIDLTDVKMPINSLKSKVLDNLQTWREDDTLKIRLQKTTFKCADVRFQIADWYGIPKGTNSNDMYYPILEYGVSPDGGSLEDNAAVPTDDTEAPDATERDLGPPAGSIPLQERGNKLMNGTDTPVKIIADIIALKGLPRVAKLETFRSEDGYVTFEKGNNKYAYKSDSELTLYDPEPKANSQKVKEQPFNTLWEQGMESIRGIKRGDFEITDENLYWDSEKGLMFLNAHKTSAEEVSPLDDEYKMQWSLFTTLMKLKYGWDWKEISGWDGNKIKSKIKDDKANGSKIFMYAKYIYRSPGTIFQDHDAGVDKKPSEILDPELGKYHVGGTKKDYSSNLLASGYAKNPSISAEKWIKNHGTDLSKPFYFLTKTYWKNPVGINSATGTKTDFETELKSIKELLFDKDINFAPVLEAFGDGATEKPEGGPEGNVRSSFLDYDSMSDQELNELERELDEMTDLEYDSSSATSANSYNSSSDTDS